MAIINERADQLPAIQRLDSDQAALVVNGNAAYSDSGWQTAYSLSAPGMRKALISQSSISLPPIDQPPHTVPDDKSAVGNAMAPIAISEATTASTSGAAPSPSASADIDDLHQTVDPCKKVTSDPHFVLGDEPKALERVKDRDPELYAEIKAKVKDPRYIGQTGDITVATHDRKGHINGCTFIQNTPYWLSANGAKSYLAVNVALALKHKKIEVDHLNGAGRTLGQEEGIAWRNTGVHAKPGKSNHGFGRAIDLQNNPDVEVQPSDDPDIREALHANGYRQGDSHGPLKNDLHHWSYVGPGRATEGHAILYKHYRKHHD